MIAAMTENERKKTLNRDNASVRPEFAIMERVKEHSFYPKRQETVNPFAQRPAARTSRLMAMMSSLSPTFRLRPGRRNGIEKPQVRFCATQLQRMRSRVQELICATQRMAYTRRSNGQAFKSARETHAPPNQLRAPGLGGGVGRCLGVKCGLAVGVGLGVGVALPETVAVAVAVGVAVAVLVAVAVGVDVEVAVAVGDGVTVSIGVAVAVATAVAVGVGLIVAVAVAVAVAVGVAVAVAVELGVAVAVGVCVAVAVAVGVGVGVPPVGMRKA